MSESSPEWPKFEFVAGFEVKWFGLLTDVRPETVIREILSLSPGRREVRQVPGPVPLLLTVYRAEALGQKWDLFFWGPEADTYYITELQPIGPAEPRSER